MHLKKMFWISMLVLAALVFAIASNGLFVSAGSIQRADGGAPIPPPPPIPWTVTASV
jgi:hypothetical protein